MLSYHSFESKIRFAYQQISHQAIFLPGLQRLNRIQFPDKNEVSTVRRGRTQQRIIPTEQYSNLLAVHSNQPLRSRSPHR